MRHQQGASYIAILIAIIGFAFMAKVAIAVWGPYFDDRMLDNQIEEQLLNGPKNLSPQKFIGEMDKRLSMNNIRDIKFADVAQVTNVDGLEVKKEYEIRKPFLLNIDIVMKFEKSFDQSSVQAK
ncbi:MULTISPECIES: DUF4845 domain-containing protein [Acinetobacter]|jgi:hypothetical protein|uniref:DUF4845 domain-containing protein n=1 Tax=Acinetobacter towneri TaxID=202956 RepID=A0AAP9GW66_9GAMM|nr:MULTISPECIES: DUF4845 domain-containing protein [Acinetobacter]GIT82447.1 DUF4845 domain-containing protein [Acinetobacter seohaensis]AVH48172.1 DUF4845 domain-containing protein [Acinetobacter sp. SWBY1]ENV70539.1 hypothetical protein F947_00542 [Acinetobacter towneri DSM 14962 = CIP 107472]MBT0887027.1 DUF4845 domain-containing protein [Acinetobacter towneri]MCA4778218.1 DUF4845 domain-containing protein [Acinetobacter towneri]